MEASTEQIYLDYAAATPVDPAVLDAMLPYFGECFYNPSAPYALAAGARRAYEEARETLAHLMGAKPANITLTAGATEANNLAFAAAGGEVVASAIEHESVLACVRERGGSLVGVDGSGTVSAVDVVKAITPLTGLVSVSAANGEIGTMQPLREIAHAVREERQRRLAANEDRPIWLHTDASQAAGAMALNVSSLCADMVTVSAAKIYGPKQVGLLWTADGIPLKPLVFGGGQEGGVRSGTENVAGVIGFAKALELASGQRKDETMRLQKLRDRLQRALLAAHPWAVVSGPAKGSRRLPGLLHISYPGLQARRLVILLDRHGVSVGTGSACAASKMRVSHVLQAIGMDERCAEGSLRITLGRPTTQEQVDQAARIINDVVASEVERTGGQRNG